MSATSQVAWRESVFNVAVPGGRGTLLFNTLTGQVCHLEAPLGSVIERSPRNEEWLRSAGFLVDSDVSIESEYAAFLRARTEESKRIFVLFTTTTECNLACSYCFQNRIRRTPMSAEVLEAALRWLRDRVAQLKPEWLDITLFGGEPLLATDLATDALARIRALCDEAGCTMRPAVLTTNGLHDDPGTLAALASAGVGCAQVTLDGSQHVNNARRRPRLRVLGQEETDVYGRVMKNLRLYQRHFALTVKLNFDRSTVASVPQMLDSLKSVAGLEPGTYELKPEPIAVSRKLVSGTQMPDTLYDPTRSELADAFALVIDECQRRGIRVDPSAVFPTPCMVSQANSFLLEPDGHLRSCISAFGLDEFALGKVTAPGSIGYGRERFSTSLQHTRETGCVDRRCAYLPVCDGGCKYELHLAGEPLSSMQCKHEYFSAVMPTYVRQHAGASKKLVTFTGGAR